MKHVILTDMFRCVSCGKNKFSTYRRINGYLLIHCLNCGLLLTRANEKQRKKYIHEKYTYQYTENYRLVLPKLYGRFIKHVSLIEKYKNEGRLLDVGCGTGYFLKFIKDNYKKWSVFGVEPNWLLRRVASRNTNEKIKKGILSNIPFVDNYFDVITCYDVLEHSIELKKNILELQRVLKPTGLLLIQAPNYKSFMPYITGEKWDWWCIPDHVLHFSYKFLTNYLKKNGFTILESYTYEDQVDYLSNIKSLFTSNYISKVIFYILVPVFLAIEWIGWLTNRGALTIVVARKM